MTLRNYVGKEVGITLGSETPIPRNHPQAWGWENVHSQRLFSEAIGPQAHCRAPSATGITQCHHRVFHGRTVNIKGACEKGTCAAAADAVLWRQ